MSNTQTGRLIDHLHLVVRDLEASKRFYRAALAAVGVPVGGEGPDHLWADELYISGLAKTEMKEFTGRVHLAFQAKDRATVEKFHRDCIAAGGTDNGAPGVRSIYAADYYAAFVLDPDGNNIEAVHHG